jgi:arylsulfatase A-like enzyme
MFDSKSPNYARYLGAIRYIDDTVDSLLRELDRRGLMQTTIVVITSDHGEQFGEHGLSGPGNSLYRPLLHVPLLVLNAPGAAPGTRVRQSVSLRDLPATLLDLAAIPNRAGLGGTSLRPLLTGAPTLPTASPVLSELNPRISIQTLKAIRSELKSLIDDSSHVIESVTGGFEIFAYPVDTAESHDLATAPAARQSAADRLRRALEVSGIVWKRTPIQ